MFENFTFAPSPTTTQTMTTSTTTRGPEDTRTTSKNTLASTYTSTSTAPTANDALSSLRGLTLDDGGGDDVRCKRQSFARMQTDEAVLRAVRDMAARMGEGNTAAARKLSAQGGGVVKRRRSPGRKGTTLAV